MSPQSMKDLFEDLSQDVVEVDLAPRAWAAADGLRSRRRWVTAGGVAAAAAAVVVALVWTGRPGAAPLQVAAPTTSSPAGASTSVSETGAATSLGEEPLVTVAPPLGTEGTLPLYEPLGPESWPQTIDTRQSGKSMLAKDIRGRIAYAYLTSGPQPETYHPTVVLEGGAVLTASDVTLTNTYDTGGNQAIPDVAIDGSGSYVAFPQPGEVIVIGSGSLRTFTGMAATTERIIWQAAGPVGLGDAGAWLADLRAPSTTATEVATPHRPLELDDGPAGAAVLSRYDADGTVEGTFGPIKQVRDLDFGGVATANLFAADVWFSDLMDPVDNTLPYQGLYAARVADGFGTPTSSRILAMGEEPLRTKGCCQVLGLGDDHTVLYRSYGETTWLLAWDIDSGLVRKVAPITGAQVGITSFALPNGASANQPPGIVR